MPEEIKQEEKSQESKPAQPVINAKVIVPIVNNDVKRAVVEGAELNVAQVASILEAAFKMVGNQKYQ